MASKKEYSMALRIGAKVDRSVGSSISSIEKRFNSMAKTIGGAVAIGKIGQFAFDYAKDATQQAIEFESTMASVAKVVDGMKNADGSETTMFAQMEDDILSLSKQIPMTVNEIGEIIASAGQAGIETAELSRFAETAAKMGIAFDTTADQAGTWMATWRTSMQLTQDEVEALADQINYLGNTSSEDALKLSEAVTRVGAFGKMAGMTGGEVAALAASMPGVEAEIAATGIKNMIKAMTAGSAATNKQSSVLARLGFNADNLAESMQTNATGSILDFMEALGRLPEAEQNAAVIQYFGSESVTSVTHLISNVENLRKQFEKVGDAAQYAGSMEAEYANMADTTENKIQLMKNRIAANKIEIGDSFLPIIDKGTELIAKHSDEITDKIEVWLPKIEQTADYILDNSDEIIEKLETAAKIGATIWATDKVVKFGSNAIKVIEEISKALPALKVAMKVAESGATTFWGGAGATIAPFAAMSAGIGLVASAPFAAVTAGYYGISKAIDAYQQSMIGSGLEAGALSEGTDEIIRRSDEVEKMFNEYTKLNELEATGGLLAEDEARRKELEQWFIDNYGQFISAEEKKNGIRQQSIDFINQYNQAIEEQRLKELEQSYEEGKKTIPELQTEIAEKTAINNETSKRRDDAVTILPELERVKAAYDIINSSLGGKARRDAVSELMKSNQEIFESYKNLTGMEFTIGEAGGKIDALVVKIQEWNSQIERNDGFITQSKEVLQGYKNAAKAMVEIDFGMSFAEAAANNAPQLNVMKKQLESLLKEMNLLDGSKEISITDLGTIEIVEKRLEGLEKDYHDMEFEMHLETSKGMISTLSQTESYLERINRQKNVEIKFRTSVVNSENSPNPLSKWEIQHNAVGTSYADDIFVGGENGPELMRLRSGREFLIGQNGAELVTGYEGASVYSNPETRSRIRSVKGVLSSFENSSFGNLTADTSLQTSFVYSPTIQVQSGSETEMRQVMHDSYSDFQKMMDRYLKDKRRKEFA